MPNPSRGADLVGRGLYAGISEAAAVMGVSRQYISRSYSVLPWLRPPLGFLSPRGDYWPYWFLRDVVADMRRRDKVANEPLVRGVIEPWEYEYTGRVVTADGVAKLCGISGGNVHLVVRERLQVPPADVLKVGALWRESEILDALKALEESAQQ